VPLPEKFEIVPFVKLRSLESKVVVDSEEVKVNDRLASFEVLPVATSLAAMVIVGLTPSIT